jgi:hypothetical protein
MKFSFSQQGIPCLSCPPHTFFLRDAWCRHEWLCNVFFWGPIPQVDSKAAQCGGLMQSNARMEKTIFELQASLSAVGKDLEEMKKSGMYGPHTEASGQYQANFGDVGGGDVSAEPGGAKVFIGPAEAEAKVAELEAQQSALISEMTEQKLMNLRLEEEAAKIR